MNTTLKKTIKLTSGVCAALGVVTLGAVMASGVAMKVVAEGIRAGVDGMKKTISELQAESETAATIPAEESSEN